MLRALGGWNSCWGPKGTYTCLEGPRELKLGFGRMATGSKLPWGPLFDYALTRWISFKGAASFAALQDLGRSPMFK